MVGYDAEAIYLAESLADRGMPMVSAMIAG